MSEAHKEQILHWLRATTVARGVLVRGIRFADETFHSDVDARDFPTTALEQTWRIIADTFQVLKAQRLPPSRLTWVHEKTTLHCAQRADGAILGIFVSRKTADVDTAGVERTLTEFLQLPVS
jgi:hypothetical protein